MFVSAIRWGRMTFGGFSPGMRSPTVITNAGRIRFTFASALVKAPRKSPPVLSGTIAKWKSSGSS